MSWRWLLALAAGSLNGGERERDGLYEVYTLAGGFGNSTSDRIEISKVIFGIENFRKVILVPNCEISRFSGVP